MCFVCELFLLFYIYTIYFRNVLAGIGAILRYLIGLIPVGAQNNFPIKTLLINVIGAFVIGLISVSAEKYQVSPLLVLTLTGVCGGFTTFSTFALETDQLIQSGNYGFTILYIGLSVILSVAAVFAAQILMK